MIPAILKGDDTRANGRSIKIELPDVNLEGVSIRFGFLGHVFDFAELTGGEPISVDFTEEQTRLFPCGTHAATLRIGNRGIWHTVSNTIPIKVTEDVSEAYGGDAANVNLSIDVSGALPDLSDVEANPKTSNELATAFGKLLRKLRGGIVLAAALFCSACLGDPPKTAPIGDVPFTQTIVTNAPDAFAPISHIEDHENPHRVTPGQIGALTQNDLRSSYWTSDFTGAVDRASRQLGFGDYKVTRDVFTEWKPETEPDMGVGDKPSFDETYKLWIWNDLHGERYEANGEADSTRIRFVHDIFGDTFWASRTKSAAAGDFLVGSSAITNLATKAEVSASGVDPELEGRVDTLGSTVAAWEGYWGGSNVVWEVTNYYGNTSGELPKLRLKELITEGEGAPFYREVWNDLAKFEIFASNLTEKVEQEVAASAAPKAWGTVTDNGEENVVENSVWMTSPQTIFAGGTEYQRVAVGEGAICVLTARGAEAYTTGEAGTFRFQDEGGTNYFGFAKTDSYTIGCDTDGIKVEGGLVTLTYNVVMAGNDVPVIYYRPDLTPSSRWVQLNNEDGSAADGAPYSVTFGKEGAKHLAFLNVSDAPSGFFKAETSVAGDVVFETNMKMRLDGGVLCTDGQTIIYPHANGTWSTTK